ncbi:hypothetical protein JCM3770_000646, partial [Rhodotorula araucariae]
MASTPRKRAKLSTAPGAPPLVEAYARLRATLLHVQQLSSTANHSSAELQSELQTLAERINTYQAALAVAPDDPVATSPARKDDLDSAGALLWNRSVAYKHALLDLEDQNELLTLVARLRFAAYRLIRLGALDSLTHKDFLAHLSLATKVATALLDANCLATVEPLMLECAKLVSALEQDAIADTASPAERAKGLLAYFCFRMRFSLATNNISLVHWAIRKAKDLLNTTELPWRDVERLVQTIIAVCSHLLQRCELVDASVDGDNTDEMARDWLQWVLELLDTEGGQDVRALQVVALKYFARACLVAKTPGDHRARAEEALKQLLDIEPSPSVHRRLVNLVVTRDSTNAEIKSVFLDAAKSAALSNSDATRLIATLEQLPGDRKHVRLGLLADVAAELSTWGIVKSDFLAQVIVAAVWLATETDKTTLRQLLKTVQQGLPNFRLSAIQAFSAVSWIRRFGDQASLEKRHADAAEWYLLATSSAFCSLPPESTSKTIRKTALSYLYAEQYDRVEEVMQLVPSEGEQAKDHFMLFCARQKNPPKAVATLKIMVAAPGFTPSLLQWAHKLAVEHGNDEVKQAVLTTLFQLCEAPEQAAQLDYMVLARSVIRQHIASLQDKAKSEDKHCETAQAILNLLESTLVLARRLQNSDDPPASLGKEMTWLYKTSYNLCAEYCARWSTSLATGFFAVTATLIEIARELGGDPVDATNLWTCKMAVVAGKYALAKEAGAEDKTVYKALVEDVDVFLDSLKVALVESPQLAKAEQLLEAGFAAKVDALAQLEDWKGLVAVIESFEEDPSTAPLSVTKLIVDTATKSKTCPLEYLHAVLRKTLALLYSQRDLDVPSMALWLRMLVYALLDRREVEQALEYVQNAQQFIEQHQDEYPEDEASWMLTTAWDE